MSAPSDKINLESINNEESLEVIWNMINKAATKGAFNIDEAYILKILFTKIKNIIVENNTTIDTSI